MIEMFTYFGMCVAIAIGIFVITGLMGWMADDDDNTLRWIMTCIFYAITTTILINLLIK